ncbi:MAG TPA: 50S ribosomal protein L33 [Candidatus Paceibacterota bacterium]
MSQESLIKLKCKTCMKGVYFTTKNKKLVTRKIEYKKFCKVCRKHQPFKEVKLTA